MLLSQQFLVSLPDVPAVGWICKQIKKVGRLHCRMAPALLELLSFLRTLEALEALEAVAFIALLFQEASTKQHLAKRREQAREDVNCAGVLYFEMWNDYNRCETDAKQYFLASFFRLSLVVLPFNAASAVQNLD